MFQLTTRSLARRPGGFLAGFLAVFFGAAMVMAFGSLLDTAAQPGAPESSVETLEVMAFVVGGWGLALVTFAVVSTMSLTVRQRAREMALLKSVGATPGQLRRLVVGETLALALVAAVAAIPVAMALGRLLFAALEESGQIEAGMSHAFGPVAVSMGMANALLAALVGALITARRATATHAAEALADASGAGGGGPLMGRGRWLMTLLALVATAASVTVTLTVLDGEGVDVITGAGPGVVAASVLLALLSPVLLRGLAAVLGGPLRLLCGVSGELAVRNVRQRTGELARAVAPVTIFTGASAGTLSLQRVENLQLRAEGAAILEDSQTMETMNYVVVGIIAAFCCIMLVNTLVSATAFRRREFGQQRLAGATPRQVFAAVGVEGLLVAGTGIVSGLLASVLLLLPFGQARADTWLPDDGVVWAIHGAVAGAALLVTLAACVGTARRVVRRSSAVDAVLAA
ncbi:FtsX-like permease family protein [Streptomyces sp. 3MP-14]|uniref:FtsX-like permease family protein n=1 Tax=Streptomyces mimosae TaxID=2586635 RepID=A0A5N6AB37_9ACTN|nr:MULTISPECIES: ABC transporter permease [Streptomyces]KAB8165156.1 FtsX-like permease family protein [Streptomyces mimosae]KAB8175788.1 FtsX-like permease family protein [Streptomyces sp. 3MP-14]